MIDCAFICELITTLLFSNDSRLGDLEGDTVAPFHFNIVLEYILRYYQSAEYGLTITPRKSCRVQAVTATDLNFCNYLELSFKIIKYTQRLGASTVNTLDLALLIAVKTVTLENVMVWLAYMKLQKV